MWKVVGVEGCSGVEVEGCGGWEYAMGWGCNFPLDEKIAFLWPDLGFYLLTFAFEYTCSPLS